MSASTPAQLADTVHRHLQRLTSLERARELFSDLNLDRAFEATPTAAVRRELDYLRRNGIQGTRMVDHLVTVYQQHRLQDRDRAAASEAAAPDIPQVVCSLALV